MTSLEAREVGWPGIRSGEQRLREPADLFHYSSLFPGGVGNTDHDPERFASLFADVTHRVFDVYGDDTIVHPGHGKPTTLGAERPSLPEWERRGW